MAELPDPVTLIPFLFALAIVPVVAVMVTSYTKLVIVFALLRNALGLQQVPPAMVTNGLALVLTWFVMYPIAQEAMKTLDPSTGMPPKNMTLPELVSKTKEPMREFLQRHASEREQAFFLQAAQRMMPGPAGAAVKPSDFIVLVPAFTISELTEAFLIGFLIFLPFIVIDLVVANVLLSLGMQMMSPMMVSLPLKLLLFVMLDGWSKLAHALVLSYSPS